MLHTLTSVIVLLSALCAAELVRHASPPVAGLTLLAVSALAALVASRVSPAALVCGAVAAIAWALLRPITPALAGAAWVLGVFLARGARIALVPARMLHGAVAASAGGISGWALSRYDLPLALGPEPIAAAVVTITVLALPFAVHAEDPGTHALIALARRSRGLAKIRLLRAAALRRRALGPASALSLRPAERRTLQRAFDDLWQLVGRSDGAAVPAPLAAIATTQIVALSRAVRALGAVQVVEHGLDASRSEAALTAAEHAEARREALRALEGP